VTIRETERANHAYDIVNQELKPEDFDAIVTVSGDGLIHEVVNGAMQRRDRQVFLDSVVIGFIPGGTGNGLVKSVLAESDEEYGVLEAAYLVVRGRSKRMDLTELTLEYEPDRRIYSFLLVAWAIIADCDINSEVLRCLGSPRFTIWGVWRCLSIIRYPGTFTFEGDSITNRA